jgi:phage-related protein
MSTYRIVFYRNIRGEYPVFDYIQALGTKHSKDSRIKFNKISDYMSALSEHGATLGEPYMKHLDGDIWELRPIRDRILFAAWDGETFIILHQFVKKTQKTPPQEIETAKQRLKEAKERAEDYE